VTAESAQSDRPNDDDPEGAVIGNVRRLAVQGSAPDSREHNRAYRRLSDNDPGGPSSVTSETGWRSAALPTSGA